MKRIAVIAVLFALAPLPSSEAVTLNCYSVAGAGRGWSWRHVDGRRCWYRGPRKMARSNLRWPNANAETRQPAPLPSPIDQSVVGLMALHQQIRDAWIPKVGVVEPEMYNEIDAALDRQEAKDFRDRFNGEQPK